MMERNITGMIFGRLTAIRKDRPAYWLFQCSCGTSKVIGKSGVTSGLVRSCGCLHIERCKSGLNQTRHGDARVGRVTRLHNIWRALLNRVNGVKCFAKNYSERGITICDEWREFETFKAWATANGYADNLTIERVDNDGPYAPENCVWATRKVQARNRRTSRRITAFGRTQVLAAWSEEFGIKPATISRRLKVGWTPEAAISTQPGQG